MWERKDVGRPQSGFMTSTWRFARLSPVASHTEGVPRGMRGPVRPAFRREKPNETTSSPGQTSNERDSVTADQTYYRWPFAAPRRLGNSDPKRSRWGFGRWCCTLGTNTPPFPGDHRPASSPRPFCSPPLGRLDSGHCWGSPAQEIAQTVAQLLHAK